MNKILMNDPVLKSIPIDKFSSYLERSGWTKIDHPNDRIFLFQGPLDDDGKALQLILPRDHNLADADNRLAEALNLLALVQQTPPDIVLHKISADKKDQKKSSLLSLFSISSIPAYVWQRTSANPMLSSIIMLLLIGAGGAYLAYSHHVRQKLIEKKVDVITNILKQVSEYEETVIGTAKEINVIKISGQDGVMLLAHGKDAKTPYNQSQKLRTDILNSLNENRLLLGDNIYDTITHYIDTTYDYYFNVQTEELREKRNREMGDLYQLPKKIVEG